MISISTLGKKSFRFIKTSLLIIIIFFSAGFTRVLATGKPVGKKRLYLIPAFAYFYNNKFWDGNYQKFDIGSHYRSDILSLTSEYGLSRRVSLVGSVPYFFNKFTQGNFSASGSGLGDVEAGMRYYFANIDYNIYFSVQGTVIVPLYSNNTATQLGYDKLGNDVRFLTAGDFAIGEKKFYFEGYAAARQYYGGSTGPFQLRYSASLSYNLTKSNQLSLAETGLNSYSSDKTFNPINPFATKYYSFQELTLSVSHSFERNKSLFVSYTQFVAGQNIGIGTTFSVGYVYKY